MKLAALFSLAAIAVAQNISYSYDQAGRLSRVAYPDGKVLSYTYDASGSLLRRAVVTPATGPAPAATAAGVVNAASLKGNSVAPGEIIAIFGNGIGPAEISLQRITAANFFDTLVGETTVTFDGIPAPVIYAFAGQTAVIVPYAVAGQSETRMVVTVRGLPSAPVTVPVVAAAPALFSANATGTGNGAILNQDGTRNSAENPAAPGSIVVLYGTGEGQTSPRGVDGKIALTSFPKPVLSARVSIGGIDATSLIKYVGAAPTLVAGVFQMNVEIPAGMQAGNAEVIATFGTAQSQSGLTVAIR